MSNVQNHNHVQAFIHLFSFVREEKLMLMTEIL